MDETQFVEFDHKLIEFTEIDLLNIKIKVFSQDDTKTGIYNMELRGSFSPLSTY
jgi:hypothetical protein